MKYDTGDYTRTRSLRGLLDEGEDGPDRGGLLSSPRVDGGYTFSPGKGLISTPAPVAQPLARDSLLDYMNQWGQYTPMDWSSIAPQLAKMGIGEKGVDGSPGWVYRGPWNPESGQAESDAGWALSPDSQAKLAGYTLGDATQQDRNAWQRQIFDPSGQAIGQSNEDRTRTMPWLETVVPMALAAMGSSALGPLLSGAGSAGSSVAGAGLEAQSAIDAYLASNPVTVGGLMSGVPEIGAITAGSIPSFTAGLGSELQASIADYAGSLTPQQVSATMPDIGSLMGGAQSFPVNPQSTPSWVDQVPSEIEQSLQQAAQQTPAQINATMPDVSAIPTTVPTTGLDSFRKSELDGYQTDGRMPSPAVPEAPPTTGLSDFRADELKGYETDGRLPSPAVPTGAGGLLGTLKGAGGTALDWMKTNPGLAKLLLGGAGSLLGGAGGSSGGAPRTYGPAVKWNSPVSGIPQGLLGGGQAGQSGGQSGYPPAMGLLGGQPNSGAWRFLR